MKLYAYHLGNGLCGDDGYCPFEEGEYIITEEKNSVNIKWLRRYNYSESSELSEYVYEETFELPTN